MADDDPGSHSGHYFWGTMHHRTAFPIVLPLMHRDRSQGSADLRRAKWESVREDWTGGNRQTGPQDEG